MQSRRRESVVESILNVDVGLSHERSRAEFVYETLHEAIMTGKLRPGGRVREAELAAWLKVSRTPVREALRRLQVAGLVGITGARGLVILEFTQRQTFEIYRVREALEGMAARLAATHATDIEIAKMGRLLDEFDDNITDHEAIAAINREFHAIIFGASQNTYLTELLYQMQAQLALIRHMPRKAFDRPDRENADHRRMLAAIGSRDADGAEAAAREHVRHALHVHIAFANMPN